MVARGNRVLSSQQFLISGTDEYPGIAVESLKPWIRKWRKRVDSEKLKNRIDAYNDLFESCVAEEYIAMRETNNGPMPAKGPKFDELHGISGLVQSLAQKFDRVWYLMLAVASYVIGRYGEAVWARIRP